MLFQELMILDSKEDLMGKAQDSDEWRRFSRRARYSDAGHSNDWGDPFKYK